MVKAEYAGCGKSYACKEMEKRGPQVLFQKLNVKI